MRRFRAQFPCWLRKLPTMLTIEHKSERIVIDIKNYVVARQKLRPKTDPTLMHVHSQLNANTRDADALHHWSEYKQKHRHKEVTEPLC